MASRDALPGYTALTEGVEHRDSVPARAVLDIMRYFPGRAASRVRCPILFCVSTSDSVAPSGPTLRYAQRAPHGVIDHEPSGHFALYYGDAFERLIALQTQFLLDHMTSAPRELAHDQLN